MKRFADSRGDVAWLDPLAIPARRASMPAGSHDSQLQRRKLGCATDALLSESDDARGSASALRAPRNGLLGPPAGGHLRGGIRRRPVHRAATQGQLAACARWSLGKVGSGRVNLGGTHRSWHCGSQPREWSAPLCTSAGAWRTTSRRSHCWKPCWTHRRDTACHSSRTHRARSSRTCGGPCSSSNDSRRSGSTAIFRTGTPGSKWCTADSRINSNSFAPSWSGLASCMAGTEIRDQCRLTLGQAMWRLIRTSRTFATCGPPRSRDF